MATGQRFHLTVDGKPATCTASTRSCPRTNYESYKEALTQSIIENLGPTVPEVDHSKAKANPNTAIFYDFDEDQDYILDYDTAYMLTPQDKLESEQHFLPRSRNQTETSVQIH